MTEAQLNQENAAKNSKREEEERLKRQRQEELGARLAAELQAEELQRQRQQNDDILGDFVDTQVGSANSDNEDFDDTMFDYF